MTSISKNSASARLLGLALESGAARDDLAAALGVAPALLDDFLAVRERIPLAAQLALADWVEHSLPGLAQRARRLRAQARAAEAMAQGVTERHAYPPPRV